MSDDLSNAPTSEPARASAVRRRMPVTRRPPSVPMEPASPAVYPELVDADPQAARRAEWLVSGLFLLSALSTVSFVVGYLVIKLGPGHTVMDVRDSNIWLGLSLAAAMLFLGAAAVMWAKRLMPEEEAVQAREEHYSTREERAAAAAVFRTGTAESGFTRRPILRRSMLAAMGILPVPAVFLLRDLGPLPKNKLRQTAWGPGKRMVDVTTGEPVKLGDIRIGGFATVMPEGANDPEQFATSPTLLIRLRPGEDRPVPGHEGFAAADHVAYNKICTHAGCPIGLYEQQTHQLFCPCHQSTFDVLQGAKVVFGPAARPLPQLAITVDQDGYFRAVDDYPVPVGPSFWERG